MKKSVELIEYYKNKGLLIVGLNDSQGVNTTPTFFRLGLLEKIALSLTSEELTPQVINAFSLTMNKTEHIDYFLRNNLSLKEIKLSQIYSVISALEKIMIDINLPIFLKNVGNVYRLIYTPMLGDEKIKISSSIEQAQEPIVIYSSGVNDLMREVGANPFGIKHDYATRDKRPNYYYTLEKIDNPKTLQKVIASIKKNYDTILGINSCADIYTLGAYIPKALQKKEMNIFRDLIIEYNEKLLNLCREYGITFVDTEAIGKHYNNSESNFHITSTGHDALAICILSHMYQKKIAPKNKNTNIGHCEITNDGSKGVIESIRADFEKSYEIAKEMFGYQKLRELEIAAEHKREMEVFQKVLKHKI